MTTSSYKLEKEMQKEIDNIKEIEEYNDLNAIDINSINAKIFDNLNDMSQEEILSHLIPTEKMFMHLPKAQLDPFFNKLYLY